MKIATSVLYTISMVLAVGISDAQEVNRDQPYTIQRKETETSSGGTIFTKTYHLNGKSCLIRTSTVTETGEEVAQGLVLSPLRISKKLASGGEESDRTVLIIERGLSAFGWYGEKDKSVFDTIYVSPVANAINAPGGKVNETSNLLVLNKSGEYCLLDKAGLDMVKANGIIATIESRMGEQLAKKKGIVVREKLYLRDETLVRCQEVVVELGPDEQEKRYTFFGSELGSNFKILEWTVNSKSKLSWIDCETGFGGFSFQDNDGDGVYETLELVIDDKGNVEIFDVSDPWNISLVPLDSDLFKDANESKARADAIRKAGQEFMDQGLLEYSEDGKLISE